MIITSGKLKFKKIECTPNKKLRPTSSLVRQAIFNILENRYNWSDWCSETHLLDLYSGTGIITLEALSRNVNTATCIEEDSCIFQNLKKNFFKLDLLDKVNLINKSFFEADLKKNIYSVVYLDPPFHHNLANKSILYILNKKILKKNSILISETEKNYKFDAKLLKNINLSKNYGNKDITFFLFD